MKTIIMVVTWAVIGLGMFTLGMGYSKHHNSTPEQAVNPNKAVLLHKHDPADDCGYYKRGEVCYYACFDGNETTSFDQDPIDCNRVPLDL